MAEERRSGPDPVSEEEQLFSRPAFLNAKIRKLLTTGTALDLRTPEGEELRQCFTPSEADRAMHMPMPEVVGFDGVTCDACRGMFRFVQCRMCHGEFDPAIHFKGADPFLPARTQAGIWEKISNAWHVLRGHDAGC